MLPEQLGNFVTRLGTRPPEGGTLTRRRQCAGCASESISAASSASETAALRISRRRSTTSVDETRSRPANRSSASSIRVTIPAWSIWSSSSCQSSVALCGHTLDNTPVRSSVPGMRAGAASCLSARGKAGAMGRSAHEPRMRRIGSDCLSDLVERLLQRVPGEGRALDADRELHDALQRLEVAQPYAFEVRL